MDFTYAEYPPPRDAQPWVLSLWSFHAKRALEEGEPPYTVWPDGCVSIAFVCAPDLVLPVCVGPRVTAMTPPVRAQSTILGVRFWPDAASDVLGVDVRSLRDHQGFGPPALLPLMLPFTVRLRTMPPSSEKSIREWLTICALDLVRNARQPEPRVRAAVKAIAGARGEILMDRVARSAGLSVRQLQRTFRARTGLTPREYARVRRLREALSQSLDKPKKGWSRVAAEYGFVDHAHLTREFVSLTGLPPTRAARHLRRTVHVSVTP